MGLATGVSDPRRQMPRIRNNHAGGQAATVAGYAGPGFHTWPLGHINQNTFTKQLLRIRASASVKKSFGETFGAATGVSDPRRQKPQTRNHHAGGKAVTLAGYGGPGFHTFGPSKFLFRNDLGPVAFLVQCDFQPEKLSRV